METTPITHLKHHVEMLQVKLSESSEIEFVEMIQHEIELFESAIRILILDELKVI